MATLLNDKELESLFEKVIIGADKECLRPNSYILRLGSVGEFTTTNKEFNIKKDKGIILPPGHSVAVTALEKIDFSKETVQAHYSECNLHGFLSPTTDLSREGLTISSTQVDAGYHGTLNWTIHNNSPNEARFIYGEKIFRLSVLLLDKDESPKQLYAGDYQGQEGYVRSARRGPPVGMKPSDWIGPLIGDSPEKKLEALINSGYPWNLLGERLKTIDSQFKTVTDEYSDIKDKIEDISNRINTINTTINAQTPQLTHDQISTIFDAKINKLVLGGTGALLAFVGAGVSVFADERVMNFIKNNSALVGLSLLGIGIAVIFAVLYYQKK